MPVAGGAFVYINYVFGEFVGWYGLCLQILQVNFLLLLL
jgi:amino acid transporter